MLLLIICLSQLDFQPEDKKPNRNDEPQIIFSMIKGQGVPVKT